MSADSITYVNRVNHAAAFLTEHFDSFPQNVIQVGTGLGTISDKIEIEAAIPYEDIPFFPHVTVASHSGTLIVGRIENQRVAILSGRFHYYEGYSTKEVTFPIRVMQVLGARRLIITNAAGGLNPLFKPGTIMVIRDHLNFIPENPLRGANIDAWGPRFPDLSEPYHPGLIRTALDCATICTLTNVVTGVYACIPGPSLETPAETRWLRNCGADGVGMSSVPETIVALHGGMQVLGLSVVANVNDPDNFQPITLEDIILTASEVAPQLERLVVEILTRISE
ncbi:MAG: purine-nucleoside phosphorylase [Desulfobacterales bacterium]|nr:purine-nucleoside phosphorylase [Deltaproteobacteria bacterium]NNK96846.1 purine-nucleoside phosphorylase [Desulfobacterales bacterium]